MKDLSPLQVSIRTIMDIVARIQWATNGLLRDKVRIDDEELVKTVSFSVLLLVWSFNEEWKRLESLAKCDERLKTTLEVVSPAIRRIRKWGKGLNRVRDQFLGHPNHRDKLGNFVPIREIFEDPKVPTAFAEMLFLGSCAEVAMHWLCNLYPEETKASTDWLMSQETVKTSKGLRTIQEARQEVKLIQAQMRERFNKTDLRLGDPHTGIFHK